ncbi:MAG: hypothetical protein H6713_21940 [Myxococcales bacterium]|nr:hypothetical protein [Myxococcales bacterium]
MIATLALLLGYSFPYAEATRNANERPRLIQGMSLVEAGSWAIDGPAARGLKTGPDVARSPVDQRLYPNKPPGATLTTAPAYWLARAHARARGEALTLRRYTWWARLLGGLAPTLLLCGFLWRRLTAGATRRGARAYAPVALALVVYALGTPANAYAHLLYGHQLAACSLWVGLIMALDAIEEGVAWRAGVGGALAGSSVAVEYAAAFAGLPIAAVVVAGLLRGGATRRAAVAASVGALAPVCALGWYQAQVFGSALATGYHHVIDPRFVELHGRGFLGLGAPTWRAFSTHILSPASGILWWAPVVVVGVAGLIARARASSGDSSRTLARVALAIFALYVLLAASLGFDGGWRVGPRYMVVALPAIALGWVWALEAARARWAGRAAILGALDGVIAALVTWSIALNTLAGNLWPHIDLTNVHQPVSEVLLPLWHRGHVPYSLMGALGRPSWTLPTLALLTGAVALTSLVAAALARRWAGLSIVAGALAALALVRATPQLFEPHPRADANLRYLERVWEPPLRGGAEARSRRLTATPR